MTQSERENRVTPAIFPAGYVGSLLSHDFDELAHCARAWRHEYTKLTSGPFQGKTIQAHTAGLQLSLAAWSGGLLVRGAVPSGGRSFALLSAPHRSARINGRILEHEAVGTRSGRDELYFVGAPGTSMVVLTIEDRLLDRTLGMIFGSDWNELGGSTPVLRMRDATSARSSLRRLLAAMCRHPERLTEPGSAAMLEEQVLMALLSRLDLPADVVRPAERLRLARRADEYLRVNRSRPVSIAELCAATGARERTLHVACREHLGLPPAAYLRALRLHGARRDLRELGKGTTVTDTATRWGFFHFGEFAGAYRRLFGEAPSETARSGAGQRRTVQAQAV
ncbi:MAG TPA: helix-turn-helix domain-containing protein [Geminicoccaceae bacterium]|nr:helix-turn-helix domain-containing protein [Geminicoccus sp.]HMU50971.1 helix-turn-helix domain-containing protein [Geminicoccaceae bacterium]